MIVLASLDTHTIWIVVLGMGLVVIAVVIVLMLLLLSFIKDIEAGSEVLVTTAGELDANTTVILELVTTATVLEEIKAEALIHHGYLASQVGAA